MNLFTCDWIFNILVVLCDGKVVCGCADPYGKRPLGDLHKQSLQDIWRSDLVREIRSGLNKGHSPFCLECGLKRFLPEGAAVPQRPVDLDILPRIFFEPTVLCNLDCFEAVCSKDSGILKTRSRFQFPLDEFQRLVDSVGKDLIRLDFFNYGDPFCHPQAVPMIEYIKKNHPHIFLYTSTNGLMLDEEKSGRLVQAGLDELTFSIDGADAETYRRYRRGGDFERLLGIVRRLVALRSEAGRDLPFINWRTILFRWNDSPLQMLRARRLARSIGVDRLTWEITDHPPGAFSLKYRPGTKAWKRIYHEIWDSSQIGSAIKGKRYLAEISQLPQRIDAAGNQPIRFAVDVKNRGGAPWLQQTASGRRLVRLGAQLFSEKRELLDLNYARAFIPHTIEGGQSAKVEIELPPLEKPGSFWLKLDMVAEGVDWFENGGSPVRWTRFRIL